MTPRQRHIALIALVGLVVWGVVGAFFRGPWFTILVTLLVAVMPGAALIVLLGPRLPWDRTQRLVAAVAASLALTEAVGLALDILGVRLTATSLGVSLLILTVVFSAAAGVVRLRSVAVATRVRTGVAIPAVALLILIVMSGAAAVISRDTALRHDRSTPFAALSMVPIGPQKVRITVTNAAADARDMDLTVETPGMTTSEHLRLRAGETWAQTLGVHSPLGHGRVDAYLIVSAPIPVTYRVSV